MERKGQALLTEHTHQELVEAIDEFERTVVYMVDLSNGIKKVVPYCYWRIVNEVVYLTVEGSNTTAAQQSTRWTRCKRSLRGCASCKKLLEFHACQNLHFSISPFLRTPNPTLEIRHLAWRPSVIDLVSCCVF